MSMARPPKKPDPIEVEPMTVYPEKPPIASDPRWGWRGYSCVKGVKDKHSFGRGTREEILAATQAYVATPKKPTPKPSSPVRTCRDLCELWLGAQEERREGDGIAPRTFLSYTASVTRLVSSKREEHIGDILLADVTDGTLEDYARRRAKGGERTKAGAPKTINDDCRVFLMAWKHGRRRKWCHEDIEYTPLKARPVRSKRTPSRAEILAIMSVLPERYALLIWLMYATGARVGEIANLEWRDCDLEAGVLSLGLHTGAEKTGARDVPIEPEVVARLIAWRDEPRKIQRGAPPPPDVRERFVLGVTPNTSVSRMMKLLRKACDTVAAANQVDPSAARITSHAIRRWAVDEMGRSSIEPASAASVTGHSPMEMWKSYRQPTLDDRRRAVSGARLGAVLDFTDRDPS
jgi:integrase